MTKAELQRILDANGHILVKHLVSLKKMESVIHLKDGDRTIAVTVSRASRARMQ